MPVRSAIATRMMHTRDSLSGVCAIAFVGLILFFSSPAATLPLPGDRGFALPSANEWLPAGGLSFACSMAANAAIVITAAAMAKIHNILRSITGCTWHCSQSCSWPHRSSLCSYTPGRCWHSPSPYACCCFSVCTVANGHPGRVLLTFMSLSALSATQYCYAVYIPAMLICCAQMRVLGGRTLVAATLGVLAPWWILFGLGIAEPSDLHLPDFARLFEAVDIGEQIWLFATAGLSASLLVLCLLLNAFKAIAYNARSRAVNGAIIVVALFTILGAAADFSNTAAYIPLLNLCAAIQTAHYFATHRADRSWIAIAAICLAYTTLFLCQILI